MGLMLKVTPVAMSAAGGGHVTVTRRALKTQMTDLLSERSEQNLIFSSKIRIFILGSMGAEHVGTPVAPGVMGRTVD